MAQTKDVTFSPELIAEAVKRAMAALGQGVSQRNESTTGKRNGHLDGKRDYPLAAKRSDLVKSASGLSLEDITLEKAASGKITFDDIKIAPKLWNTRHRSQRAWAVLTLLAICEEQPR